MSEVAAPGFFGKLPARGDFLSRRVPASVAPAWEAWLQAMTAGVRGAGVQGWQDAWLTAPLWHFTLGSQLAGPHGASGILVASVDRVGRLFPFTVIGAGLAYGAADAATWSRTAEALVMEALDESYDPATLDAALTDLGPPPVQEGAARAEGASPIVLEGDWPETDPRIGVEGGWPGPAQSVWWCRGSDRVAPVRLRCRGLPGPRTAAAMVLGGAEVTPAGDFA